MLRSVNDEIRRGVTRCQNRAKKNRYCERISKGIAVKLGANYRKSNNAIGFAVRISAFVNMVNGLPPGWFV
jgi:hypothetical protein